MPHRSQRNCESSISSRNDYGPALFAAALFALAFFCGLDNRVQAEDLQPEPLLLGQVELEQSEPGGLSVTSSAIGLETAGGVFTALIDRHSVVPAKARQTFSTFSDQQAAVLIHLLSGSSPRVDGNITLGRLKASGFTPGPARIPQIEITLEVDKAGSVKVSAKDLKANRMIKVEADEDATQRYLLPDLICFRSGANCLEIGLLKLDSSDAGEAPSTNSTLGIQFAGGKIYALLEAGAKLPKKFSGNFSTSSKNQRTASIKLYAVDQDPDFDFVFYEEVVAEGYALGANGEADLELIFEIDTHGAIAMQGMDRNTGRPLHMYHRPTE